jgi:hypothetical protein
VDAAGAVMEADFNANTILAATSDDTPAALTVAEQTIVGRITSGNIDALTATEVRTLINVEDGADVTDATNVDAAGAVMEADYNANTILAATSDDTPVALTVAEQTLVGRITSGNIDALTATEVRTLINVEDGATADQTAGEIEAIVSHDNLLDFAVGEHRIINDSGTSATELWSASKIDTAIDSAISGLTWKDPVSVVNLLGNVDVMGLVGNAAALTIEGLSPTAGDAYVVTTANGVGALSAAVVGDIWQYVSTTWTKIVSAAGGFVPNGTYALLSTTEALISPYTDSTHDGYRAGFDGTDNDPLSSGTMVAPVAGVAYVVDGSGSEDEGDLREWSGSAWVEIEAASGGYVPSGTRAILGLSASVTLISPYTEATDDGKVVSFSGSSNTGANTSEAVDGNALLVQDSGSASYYDNLGYVFEGTVPSGSWTQFTGAGQIVAGTGLTKSGNTLNVGAGTGITVNADDIEVDYGSTSSTACVGNDSRLPSQDENDALAGTSGTPSSANKYVTNDDSRNTDSRAPSGSAGGDLSGTYPNPTVVAASTTTAGKVELATQTEMDTGTDSTRAPTPSVVANAKVRVEAKTSTPYVVSTSADRNKLFTNEGATALQEFTLPTAAAGLSFSFCVQDADDIKITANTSDTIRMGSQVTAAAGNIQSSAIGDSVTLTAINATEWMAVGGFTGVWTVT